MKIHTFNTGRQYSEHGQRIAWAVLLREVAGSCLVGFYDADRGVSNVVRTPKHHEVCDAAVLEQYDACHYIREFWLDGKVEDALRLAAENHGKEAIAERCDCPSCGSGYLSGGFVNIEGQRAYQTVTCMDCGTAWVDGYALVSREPVEG